MDFDLYMALCGYQRVYLKIGVQVFYRRAIIDEWLEARSCGDFTDGE